MGLNYFATTTIPFDLLYTSINFLKKERHQLFKHVLKSNIHTHLKILWSVLNKSSSNKFLMWLQIIKKSILPIFLSIYVYTDTY